MRSKTETTVFEQKGLISAHPLPYYGVALWIALCIFTSMEAKSFSSFLLIIPIGLLMLSQKWQYKARSTRVQASGRGVRLMQRGQDIRMSWQDIDRVKGVQTSLRGLPVSRYLTFRHKGKNHKIVLNEIEGEEDLLAFFVAHGAVHKGWREVFA